MQIRSFFRRNKAFGFLSIIFIVWLTFLLVLSFVAQRNVIFYDALAEEDISSHYTSEIPLFRYIIEPLIGYALVMSNDFEWIFGIFLIFVGVRVSYYVLKKRGFEPSERAQLLWLPIKDFIRFSCLLISLSIGIGLLIAAIMMFGFGFLYLNLYWMAMVQIIIPIDMMLIALKAGHLLYKGYRSDLRFNYSELSRYKAPSHPTKTDYLSRGIRREGAYFLGITLLILGTNWILVSTYFPVQHIHVDLEEDEILCDFHVHTIMSDGYLDPIERVMWYIENGIDVAAFSDHDNLRGAKMAREFVKKNNLDLTVIMAEEWTDHENNIHMNIFGLDETIVPLESEEEGGPKAMDAEHTIKYVKDQGAYIIVNHYNYNENPDGGYGTPYTLEDLRDWGVDGFEIINGGNLKHPKIREFCLNNSLICISATDIHTNKEVNSFIKLKVEDPEDLDVDSIFARLKENKHEAVAINLQPNQIEYPSLLEELGFEFIEGFIEYFLNLDRFQILSWILWSCSFFGGFTFLYSRIKQLDVEELRRKLL